MKIEKIFEKFGNFDITSGYRMLMLIQRGKEDGENQGKDKRILRKISRNEEEFLKILNEFLEIKKDNERIYSCVNERDIDKAIKIFKQKQLDADYYNIESKNSFYLDIKNRWIGSVMKPRAKKTSYFLLDIDTKDKKELDDIKKRLCKISSNYVRYETKNGYHFICPPFNPELLAGVEIKKDGLLLLDY